MTTIELEFTNMSLQGQPPSSMRVRIKQDPSTTASSSGYKSEEDAIKQSPRAYTRKGNNRTGKTDLEALTRDLSCYDPKKFTITAYLPNEGGMEGEKRLRLHCYPGMTVQEVIDSQIPSVANKPYMVYQFPSKALLNPEKEASILQDQEIWIEPVRIHSPDEVGDERLAVVKELHRTEDAYLEHLRNIFDIYMDPMRNWGMPQSDMNTLFIPLSRLCDLLMNFFSELELAIKSWNTHTTQVGGLFTQYRSFWDMYIEYAQSYTVAMRLLKQKRKDESFSKFLDIKRGAAMHTLESLMLLPVQRVSDYQRYLTQLLSLTPLDHPDYQNISVTVTRTDEIIQARADELVYLQNESKLEQVQNHFPHDQLFLLEKPVDTSTPKGGVRSRSTVQQPFANNTSRSLPNYKSASNFSSNEATDGVNTGGIKRRLRMYVQEGPVKLLIMNKQGMFQSQERYLFLFSDLLLIAKSKARRIYHLKTRLRLSEIWISETVDAALPAEEGASAFTVGWPIINSIAVFSSKEERVLWYNAILKQIKALQQSAETDSVSIQIVNMTKPLSQLHATVIPEFLQVNIAETCNDVLKKALKHFQITESHTEYNLWVKLAKEEKMDSLRGYECIFAIQSHHNRQQLDLNADTRPQQLEFVIRKKTQSLNSSSSKKFLKWVKRNPANNKDSSKPPKQVKMYGVSLEDIIVNNQLPEKLQEILIRLWVDGPTTSGIFRHSGNARRIREVRECIDGRKLNMVDLSEEGIHVISSLLKDLVRNVPKGVLPSMYYTEFVATNDIEDVNARIQQIRKVLNKLPLANQVFLRYLLLLLCHIAEHENTNQMSTINVAICFAPSLLEPEFSLAVIKNEAPTLVEFMIRHANTIYNNELPELFRQLEAAPSEASESEREQGSVTFVPIKDEDDTELSECGDYSSFYPTKSRHKRNFSMDTATSASEDSVDEEEELSANVTRRIALHHTASDSKVEELPYHSMAGKGRITLLSDRSDRHERGTEGDSEEDEDNVSSLALKWPRSQYTSNHIRNGNNGERRRSVAAHAGGVNKPDLQLPPSPRSRNSSGSRTSPMFTNRMESFDSDGSNHGGYRSESSKQPHKKKRKPGQSNSFSKADHKSKEPYTSLPTSTSSASFSYQYDSLAQYDSLMPSERPRSSTASSILSHSDEVITSRTTAQSVPSRVSQSGATSGNHGNASPDMLSEIIGRPYNKMDPESIKHAISHRFNLSEHQTSDKMTPDKTNVGGAQSYQPSSSLDRMKRVESIETTSSIDDDRPEAERHLHSLPRDKERLNNSLTRRSTYNMMPLGYTSTESASCLTVSGDSDTESSPSRTLNRPDKLQEVGGNSPYTMRSSLPPRYLRLNDTTHNSQSSLRSVDSFDRPPSIEEHTPLSPVSQQDILSPTMDLQRPLASSSYRQDTTSWKMTNTRHYNPTRTEISLEQTKNDISPLTITSKISSSNGSVSSTSSSNAFLNTRLNLTPEQKSRSMPSSNRRTITAAVGTEPHVKVVRVIRYELPVAKKIRRINLRAYNTNK